MCIIVGEISHVSKTRILVAKLEGGKRQLTVYANRIAMEGDDTTVENSTDNMMRGEYGEILRVFDADIGTRKKRGNDARAECTFLQTQHQHVPQTYYTCRTCNQAEREGVCTVCANHCHEGHTMSPQKYGKFFCDCGADNPNCVGVRTTGVQWQAPGSSSQQQQRSAGEHAITTTTTAQGAMILPVPNGASCVPVDLSKYTELFEDLDALFPRPLSKNYSNSRGHTWSQDDSDNALAVQQVGSFKVSVVPTLQDFARLRLDVFDLDPSAQQLLSSLYSDGYGFMVCQLDAGADFHPIGYTHALFSTEELFVPTVHYHGGDANSVDWDHEIYVWGKRNNALTRFIDKQRNQDAISAVNWVNDLHDALRVKGGFTLSTASGSAAAVAQKLNRLLGSKGYLGYYPLIYRLAVNEQYAYNHDTLLHC